MMHKVFFGNPRAEWDLPKGRYYTYNTFTTLAGLNFFIRAFFHQAFLKVVYSSDMAVTIAPFGIFKQVP
jgi:hypothetical protein